MQLTFGRKPIPNETCPACNVALTVDRDGSVYDDEAYAGECPACEAPLVATARVEVSFTLALAEVDANGDATRSYEDSVMVGLVVGVAT